LDLRAEGRIAESEGRIDDAVRYYLDIVRAGAIYQRGGVIDHARRGFFVQWEGSESLLRLRGRYSERQYRGLMRELLAVHAAQEPPQEWVDRTLIVAEHQHGWPFLIHCFLRHPTQGDSFASLVRDEANTHEARFQLLLGELAIHQFHTARGRWPASLEELVPEYLTDIPEDPYSGTGLRYRRRAAGYQLYSVGFNRQDDGGSQVTSERWWDTPLDITLDLSAADDQWPRLGDENTEEVGELEELPEQGQESPQANPQGKP